MCRTRTVSCKCMNMWKQKRCYTNLINPFTTMKHQSTTLRRTVYCSVKNALLLVIWIGLDSTLSCEPYSIRKCKVNIPLHIMEGDWVQRSQGHSTAIPLSSNLSLQIALHKIKRFDCVIWLLFQDTMRKIERLRPIYRQKVKANVSLLSKFAFFLTLTWVDRTML